MNFLILRLLQELYSRSFLLMQQIHEQQTNGSRTAALPEERGKEDLSAVYLIQNTQILFVCDVVRVRFVLERFHVIVEIKFTSFIDWKPDYLEKKKRR